MLLPETQIGVTGDTAERGRIAMGKRAALGVSLASNVGGLREGERRLETRSRWIARPLPSRVRGWGERRSGQKALTRGARVRRPTETALSAVRQNRVGMSCPRTGRAEMAFESLSRHTDAAVLRFVVHARHQQTMRPYLERWAGDFRSHVDLVSYDEIFRSTDLPRCVHAFTDIERLDPEDRERAAYLWGALQRQAPELDLLNHPLLAMRRYELLRTLREAGVNDFDVYRLTEARCIRRFPVFVRGEDDHKGAESGLLESREELAAFVKGLVDAGKSRDTRMVVEFHASKGPDGLYRKYAAFYLAGSVMPRHLFIGPHWMVKDETRIRDDAKMAEERRYFDERPHDAWIASVFKRANIDYGRIDYGIVDGKPQVFEINTNPTIVPASMTQLTPNSARFVASLTAAYEALERRNGGAKRMSELPRIPLDPPLKNRKGRLVSRALAFFVRRQLRPLV